jgi:hypothetical protein
MTNHKSIRIWQATNVLIWGMVLLMLCYLVLWIIPRQTVEVYDFKTNKEKYIVGEPILITARGETFFEGQSQYDIRLFCDGGRYLLRGFEVTTRKGPMRQTKTNVGNIPAIPTPDYCVVRTQATHTIQIAPFITRTFTNQWETNRFLVEAGEQK